MRHTTMKCVAFTAFGLLFAVSAMATEVRYYPVPKGSHPHDVAVAPDGSVWYTAQRSGELGLLDQKTATPEQLVQHLRELVEGVAARSRIQIALAKWHAPNAAQEIAEQILKSLSSAPAPATELSAMKRSPGFIA